MALTAPVVSCARGSCKFSLIAVCNELSSLANISTKSLYWRIQVSLEKKKPGQIVLALFVTESTNIICINYFRTLVCICTYVTLLIRRRNFLPLDFDCEPVITNYLNLLF